MNAEHVMAALGEHLDASTYSGARVVVAIPDATRPLDLTATLGPTLTALSDAGAHVKVIVALGLHRPMTVSYTHLRAHET